MVTVRKLEPGETKTLRKTALRAFDGIERLFVGSMKEAMVALVDGTIAGGIVIQYIRCGKKKIGYVDLAFVDPDFQGRGVGKALYRETIDYLWEQGCDAVSALVKDDNVASWRLFLDNGLVRVSVAEGLRTLGFLPMLGQYCATPMSIANGMELYLAVRDQPVQPKAARPARQIPLYLLVNLVLMLIPGLIVGMEKLPAYLAAYLTLLVLSVTSGYGGTRLSKRPWTFRMNSGGALVVLLVNLGGAYPMIGNWYPDSYEHSEAFRRDMGRSALCEWIVLALAVLAGIALQGYAAYFQYLAQIGSNLLIYHMLLFYPFESFGGRRMWRWSKRWTIVLSALSILVLLLTFY